MKMRIDIPILDLEFKELILILKKYPRGKVKVKEKIAVWETELDLEDNSLPMQNNNGVGKKAGGNLFSNMAENITNAFSLS